ncbi:hypothetical protein RHSIM_RhsimUnG0166700 [Rhododendron simsii]|uniref:60S acidic ribosomal protein P2 n=1 Tax=Rhododendron simsii TaxID=118357 RepID=A0A834L4D9_RHOSS|nr:hypothetical protein RHSIM_RhsimUnG0166700 [Rhododendron simsii]
MKIIAAYLLAVLGGNTNPAADDLTHILNSVGAEVDDVRVQLLLSEVKGKEITDLIASGKEKLASVPSGGGGGAGAMVASSAGGGAPAAPAASEAKKEEKEEEKEESDGVSLNPIDCIVSGILISVTASFTKLVFYTTTWASVFLTEGVSDAWLCGKLSSLTQSYRMLKRFVRRSLFCLKSKFYKENAMFDIGENYLSKQIREMEAYFSSKWASVRQK